MAKCLEKILRPEWIVNEINEFGFSIWGITFIYYKWPTPLVYAKYGEDEDGKLQPAFRVCRKREMGEVIIARFNPENK